MKITYEIYPCDFSGECPKARQNCAECVGWNFPPEEDEEEDWNEPEDLEMGFDPYCGCYTDDC